MEFKKYQHVEKFGTVETQDIEIGLVYIFPKLDGTNGQLFWDKNNGLQAGSRNRLLSLDNDNMGFMNWAVKQESLVQFFKEHQSVRLYGEFLVPHTLKTYIDSAWRDFYVFDVYDEINNYCIPYEVYKEVLDKYDINYIPPLYVTKNPTAEFIYNALNYNDYLIKEGHGQGEGVVVKNYEYKNKFGRQTWAKIVRSEFKASARKNFGVGETKTSQEIEAKIIDKYITDALVQKEYAKIITDLDGWTSKAIPRLLNTVFYCLIKEESWEFVKEFKNPKIDFKRLMQLCYQRTKELLPEVF